MLKVLLLEDLATDVELVARELRAAGIACELSCVADEAAFRRGLVEIEPDLILSDFSLPAFDGLTALEIARAVRPHTPYIFVSGTIGEERAIESIKRGATDYVLKSNLRRLPAAITRALSEAGERTALKQAEQALRVSEERFRLLVNGVTDYAIFMLDPQGRVGSWNRGAERITGYTEGDVLGRPYAHFHAPATDPAAADAVAAAARLAQAAASGHAEAEDLLLRKDGSRFWAHVAITALHDEEHGVRGFAVVTRDVTERKMSQDKIARLSRIHAVLSGINAAIVRLRSRGELFQEACRIAVEHGNFGMAWIGRLEPQTMTVTRVALAGSDAEWMAVEASQPSAGETASGLVGTAIRSRRSAYSNDLAQEPGPGSTRRREALRRGYRSAIVLPLLVGDAVVGHMSLIAREANFFNDDEIKLLDQLAADISFALDHIEKEERLNYLAFFDALTGLPNRTLFGERLGRLVKGHGYEAPRIAVVLADIARFSLINDSFGRGAGDLVLQEVARRLNRAWPGEGNVARVGANAFAAILPEVRDASQVAHLLEAAVAEAIGPPVRVGEQELKLTLACGIALYPGDAPDPDALLRNAEAAARKAKDAGERYLFYQPDMNARVAKRLDLDSRLRHAIERGEFVLHYQPKLDLSSHRIAGLEALIRWNDPRTGLVAPAEFISLLEETGLILEVGRWAIEEALREHAALRGAGVDCPRIAVNVSAVQMRRRDFVQMIERALSSAPSPGNGLDLEITETLAMENIAENVPKLEALRDMGVGVAIDDFGTGYSSLSYIARLPVDALKIDRSFIVEMTRAAQDMAIVSTIVSLAHDLQLKVIAEGVDAEDQATHLRRLGCDQIQGNLLSKPIPAAQIGEVLRGVRPDRS